jgi:hypothetical protein
LLTALGDAARERMAACEQVAQDAGLLERPGPVRPGRCSDGIPVTLGSVHGTLGVQFARANISDSATFSS